MVDKSRTAKHEQISSYIRSLIRTKELKPGDPIMTEHEIARMFHCSRGTVQHALTVVVGEGLIRRRRGAGSFVAESRPTTKKQRVVVAVSSLLNTFVARFVNALNLAMTDMGYHMVLCSADDRRENDLRFIDQIKSPEVLGLIRFPTWIKSERETRDLIRATGVRCVIINDFWTDCHSDHLVAFDECAGVQMAISHLVRLGHRVISFIDNAVDSMRANALEAFRQALAKHKLPLDDSQLLIYDPADGPHPPLRRLYGRGKPCPTALFTPYESMARAAFTELHDLKLMVPEDVSVVCLNGADTGTGREIADITTAVPPIERMVSQALKILMDDSAEDMIRHYILKPGFHVGRTTAPVTTTPEKSLR